MHRGWMSHSSFKSEPFSEREAWVWLIENAVYKDTIIRIRGLPIEIKRGSLSYSNRFLAEAWKWESPERVRRYLKNRARWGMIELRNVALQSLITICNYEKYQSPISAFEAETRQKTPNEQGKAKAERKANKKEGKEQKELKEISTHSIPLPEWMPKEEFFAYIDFRKSIKKPIKTLHGLRLVVEKLETMRRNGSDPVAVLNQSVLNGWQGLFPIQAASQSGLPRSIEKKSHAQQMMEATVHAVMDLEGKSI